MSQQTAIQPFAQPKWNAASFGAFADPRARSTTFGEMGDSMGPTDDKQLVTFYYYTHTGR